MYCPNCGKKIPDTAKFCGYCGTPLRQNQAAGSDGSGLTTQNLTAPDGFYTRKNPTPSYSRREANPKPAKNFEPDIKEIRDGTVSGKDLVQKGLVSVIGAIMMLIGVFLPAVSVSFWGYSITYNYFNFPSDDGGIIFVIFGIVQIVLAAGIVLWSVFRKKSGVISASVSSMIVVLFCIYLWYEAVGGYTETFGAGLILSIIGAAIALTGSFLIKGRKKIVTYLS